MKIIKRNGSEAEFDREKIVSAVTRANATMEEEHRITAVQIGRIADSVVISCENLERAPSVEEVQDGGAPAYGARRI